MSPCIVHNVAPKLRFLEIPPQIPSKIRRRRETKPWGRTIPPNGWQHVLFDSACKGLSTNWIDTSKVPGSSHRCTAYPCWCLWAGLDVGGGFWNLPTKMELSRMLLLSLYAELWIIFLGRLSCLFVSSEALHRMIWSFCDFQFRGSISRQWRIRVRTRHTKFSILLHDLLWFILYYNSYLYSE